MRRNLAAEAAHLLWRHVPHRLRRRVFDEVTLRLAPRPVPGPDLRAPWVVVGALSASTGLGEAARLAVEALRRLGQSVSALDLTTAFRQTPSVAPPAVSRPAPGHGTLLVFANPPVSALALRLVPASVLTGRRIVGCWVWDFEEAPRSWARHADLFHEIVAPSRFAAAAISRAIRRPVRVLPHPVAACPIPAAVPSIRPFHVGFIGDVIAAASRKYPEAAVEAFLRAGLPRGVARLSLYLHGPPGAASRLLPAIRCGQAGGFDIRLHTGVRSRGETRATYRDLDLYLSLHRAEGFGLTVAEAMLAGVPVAATHWSATAEFVDETVGYPVPCGFTPSQPGVDDPRPRRWAEPDLDAAAHAVRTAWSDEADRRRRGMAARERIRTLFSAESFLDALYGNAEASSDCCNGGPVEL